MPKDTTLVLFEELAEVPEAKPSGRAKRGGKAKAQTPRRPSALRPSTLLPSARVSAGVKSQGRAFTPTIGDAFTLDDLEAIPSLRRAGLEEVPDKVIDREDDENAEFQESVEAPTLQSTPLKGDALKIQPSVPTSSLDDEPFLKLDPGFDAPFDYLNPEETTPDWTLGVDIETDPAPQLDDVPWETDAWPEETYKAEEPSIEPVRKRDVLELVAPASSLLKTGDSTGVGVGGKTEGTTRAKGVKGVSVANRKVARPKRVKKKAFNPLEDEPEDPRSGVKSFDPDEGRERPVRARKPRPTQSLMARALNALARREYARKGLEAKLRQGLTEEDDPDEIERVLDELEKLNYLSDERFAVLRTEQKARTQGDRRLRYELRQQGVKPEAVEAAMENLTESEEVRCYRLWERRFGEKPTDRKERERQIRYLTYRGFSFSSVMSVIRGEVNPDEEIE